jgi:phage tail-like protein
MDPFVSFNFTVEIDGIIRASFREVSGLDSSVDVLEYREGGDLLSSRKLPGRAKYANIVLRWGMANDTDLYVWHRQWLSGDPAATRRGGSIVLLDRQLQEQARWNFQRAWPARWTGPAFNAEGSDLAIETLELAHEGVARA